MHLVLILVGSLMACPDGTVTWFYEQAFEAGAPLDLTNYPERESFSSMTVSIGAGPAGENTATPTASYGKVGLNGDGPKDTAPVAGRRSGMVQFDLDYSAYSGSEEANILDVRGAHKDVPLFWIYALSAEDYNDWYDYLGDPMPAGHLVLELTTDLATYVFFDAGVMDAAFHTFKIGWCSSTIDDDFNVAADGSIKVWVDEAEVYSATGLTLFGDTSSATPAECGLWNMAEFQTIGKLTNIKYGEFTDAPTVTTTTYANRPIHTHPTGYHEGQYGPYKPARVIAFGKALRALTDRDRGDWRGGQFSATIADGTHSLKTALLAHPTQGRGAIGRAYVVSVEGGRAGATPWHWYGGPLLSWEPQRDASVALEFGDQVGHVLGGVLGADRQLPKRRVTAADFPNAPAASLGMPVPIVYWSHRTEAGIEGIPLVYVGTRVMADTNTWHEWLAAGHALKHFTYLNVDHVAVTGWGTSWAMPGQANWATVTGSSASYRDYNNRRYACVYGRGTQADSVAAGEARLSLECYGIEDAGDGTGGLIGGAVGSQTLHWWINWVLGDYQGGAWLPMPTYGSGWPQVDATAFSTIDTTAAARTATGSPPFTYAMSLYFGVQQLALPVTSDLVSIRDAIGWVARSADIRIGLNMYSQWTAAMLPDTVVDASLPLYGDSIPARIVANSWRAQGAFDAQWTRAKVLAHRSYRPPVVEGTTDWLGTETVVNTALETSLGTVIEGPTLELPFAAVYDNDTLGPHAADVAARVLARHALPTRTFTWETTRCGVSKTDLGQIVRLSHYAFPGPRRVLVEAIETGLTTAVVTGQDVTDLVPDAGSEGSP